MRCPHCQLDFVPPEDTPEGRLFCPGCGRDLTQDTKETVVADGAGGAPVPKEDSGSAGSLRIDVDGKLSLEQEVTELVFSVLQVDRKIFSYQRRFMTVKNHRLYVLFEITQGGSAEEVKRERSETEALFREVREALVIE